MNDKFKTFYGNKIDNVVEYINDYLKHNDNVDILIGCDSQRHGEKLVFGVVIILYRHGNGGHVLWRKYVERYEPVLQLKLISEVWKSVEVAEYLKQNNLPAPKFIDIDLNPDPKYDSNTALRECMGLVTGMGYNVRTKHNGAIAYSTADHLVRR